MKNRNLDSGQDSLAIFVSAHCPGCNYALEVADLVRRRYPHVIVEVIDVEAMADAVPDEVYATPTYFLNGQRWSLGNPSDGMIRDAFESSAG